MTRIGSAAVVGVFLAVPFAAGAADVGGLVQASGGAVAGPG